MFSQELPTFLAGMLDKDCLQGGDVLVAGHAQSMAGPVPPSEPSIYRESPILRASSNRAARSQKASGGSESCEMPSTAPCAFRFGKAGYECD